MSAKSDGANIVLVKRRPALLAHKLQMSITACFEKM